MESESGTYGKVRREGKATVGGSAHAIFYHRGRRPEDVAASVFFLHVWGAASTAAEAEAGRVHGRTNCSQFGTDAQKLALSEKCLQSLSPRTIPVAASWYEINAEAKAGMQKQRPKWRRRKPPKKTKNDANARQKICGNSCPRVTFA